MAKIEETNQVKLAGDVIGKRGNLLIVRTIGIDSKNKPHEDLHKVLIENTDVIDELKSGDFVTMTGKILDGDMDQVIEADEGSVKPGDGKYKNLAKVVGEVKDQPQFMARTADGKPAMMNLRVTACGQKTFATLFGPLAIDFDKKCPITSTVQVYGRMRRKEIENQGGDVRKWIDIATDNYYFAGLTKVLKKGTGMVDEFAEAPAPKAEAPELGIEAMAFTPKAGNTVKKPVGKKSKVA